MAKPNWYFFYQGESKESEWTQEFAARRKEIEETVKPAFVTVLDMTGVPSDGEWATVCYRGPLYFDFDAEGDLELVINQVGVFMAKIQEEWGFDLNQLRLYASGGKGFHIEIPMECFIPKVSPNGYKWLPYVYREMAQQVIVDTLDLNIYTGKRGRQWRTLNVERENGNYKVQLNPADVFRMGPADYKAAVGKTCTPFEAEPPVCNARLATAFDQAVRKVAEQARTRKKKSEQASKILDPWKQASKHPPTILAIMRGEKLDDTVGFQRIATQLSIYATAVGLGKQEFLDMCEGLCQKHQGDSYRYSGPKKRRKELARMYEYMEHDALYVFDPQPIAAMLKRGIQAPDLGLMLDEEEAEKARKVETKKANAELKPPAPSSDEAPWTGEGEPPAPPPAVTSSTEDGEDEDDDLGLDDLMRGMRRGVVINQHGIFRKTEQGQFPVCRASFGAVSQLIRIENGEVGDFQGYEVELIHAGRRRLVMMPVDILASSSKYKAFIARFGISFQGAEIEVGAIMDYLSEKGNGSGRTIYSFPREGFFIIQNPHPEVKGRQMVPVYLTQTEFISGLPKDDPHQFTLRYAPDQVKGSYNIDLHKADDLSEKHKETIRALLSFNVADVVVDMVGWMVAAHYRSIYLHYFGQFPSLQAWGEAGSGKSQTVERLAKLHWLHSGPHIRSAMAGTSLALDTAVSTSTSAPMLIDEYKPRELSTIRGRKEKIKDIIKAAYIGSDVGDRGTINKTGDSHLSTIKSKATAPVAFMAEALEMETAIMERCVNVGFSQSYHTPERSEAFEKLKRDFPALSALGKTIVNFGFRINHQQFIDSLDKLIKQAEQKAIALGSSRKEAPRVIYNRAVVLHGMQILRGILNTIYGTEFDEMIDNLVGTHQKTANESDGVRHGKMSEMAKVLNRLALLSYEEESPCFVEMGKHYLPVAMGIEISVPRAFDQYRRYCVMVHEAPLFDTLETFMNAIAHYSATTDRVCGGSDLRREGSTEMIVRLDTARMTTDGVSGFRKALA